MIFRGDNELLRQRDTALGEQKSFCVSATLPWESARDRILDWNRYDVALVEHARAHLARRISEYPGDFEKDLVLFRKLNALFQQGVPLEDLRRIEYDALISNMMIKA